MISISLIYFCEKVLTLLNIWMIAKKYDKTSLCEAEDSYSNLNIEDIANIDYDHRKRFLNKKFRRIS